MINKLAVYVLTYNRKKEISLFLEKELNILKAANVDIYVYDSSENTDTENLTTAFQNTGFDNLYYIHMDSSMRANEKFYYVAENADTRYEYIWITHDHTVFNGEALGYILEALKNDPDFVYIKTQEEDFDTLKNEDLNTFFEQSVWQLCRFGAAIMNTRTFLCDIDWKYMKKKYLDKKRYNFSQIALYFERLSRMKSPTVLTLKFPREFFYDTRRFEKLSWNDEVVRICLECWGETIMSLPDVYKNKIAALQTIDKYFISKPVLTELKKHKLYGLKDFFLYYKWIDLIMPEKKKELFLAALLPYSLTNAMFASGILKMIDRERRNGKKICVYGAGRHSIEFIDYLSTNDIRVDNVLVTGADGNPDCIRGVKVVPSKEYLEQNKSFVIITVAKEYQAQVIDYIKDINDVSYVCID